MSESVLKVPKGPVGVSPVETLRSMSGLAFLQAMIAGELPRPPITDVLNFQLVSAEKGRVVFEGGPTFAFYNPLGTVHGGWTSTLLDSCMGCTVQTMLTAGQGYTTVELKVNMVRAVTGDTGLVRAEGTIINAGRSIATAEGRLVGVDGKLYAHATTTCLVFAL